MNKLYTIFPAVAAIHLVFFLNAIRIEAFPGIVGNGRTLTRSLVIVKSLNNKCVDDDDKSLSRRAAMQNSIIISTTLFKSNRAYAKESPSETNAAVKLDCLKDLPPKPQDCIRLYLCRHGQTENNRLRIVQGARVDPPINQQGKAQATSLGLALSYSNEKPAFFFSSNLLRAKMTAEIAANAMNNPIKPKQLSSLAEIDFGPVVEGKPVSAVQEKMAQTYSKWVIGDIDYRPEGGGDSGREVLIRACEALEALVNEAKALQVTSVAAVSHSAYLRVLLGMILDESLLQASFRDLRNGSITVVDVPKNLNKRMIGSKPKLLGGWLSRKPNDFSLDIPICNTVRINEVRHLPLDIM